jgi:hypothetical protein
MHPEILRELAAQRDSEMRERADRARLARTARKAHRAHRAAAEVDEFAIPAIPDYVDGTFRETPAGAEAGKVGRAA